MAIPVIVHARGDGVVQRVSAIEIEALHKQYRNLRGRATTALDGLNLTVPEGGVFGFLGPNGSGKTTTIRCLLGLVRQTSGDCRLLGVDPQRELARVIGRVGSIVESPAFFLGFSGRRNLEILAQIQGIDRSAVRPALERVDLGDRAGDRVKKYSFGMRQRLGIAAALLKDPEVLLLDEPANGLDPAGIKEVRELLRSLGAEGRTVFVSSHILTEVRQMCDRVAILARGKCVAAGGVDEVLSSSRASGLVLRISEAERALDVLHEAGFSASADGSVIRVQTEPARSAEVNRVLAGEGLYLSELRTEEADLETVFLELTATPEDTRP
jgi:ABC-2 type transport system ATP-binding protein